MSESVTVHVKFDDDDFNSFRGIACEGLTHRHRKTLKTKNQEKLEVSVYFLHTQAVQEADISKHDVYMTVCSLPEHRRLAMHSIVQLFCP